MTAGVPTTPLPLAEIETESDASPTSPEPSARGRLHIAQRVIEQIAAQAAIEIDGVAGGGKAKDLDGRRRRPKVVAQLDGRRAHLQLEVGLVYPGPIRRTSESVRQHISSQVASLSGVEVGRLDVVVRWLVAAEDLPRRLA